MPSQAGDLSEWSSWEGGVGEEESVLDERAIYRACVCTCGHFVVDSLLEGRFHLKDEWVKKGKGEKCPTEMHVYPS